MRKPAYEICYIYEQHMHRSVCVSVKPGSLPRTYNQLYVLNSDFQDSIELCKTFLFSQTPKTVFT